MKPEPTSLQEAIVYFSNPDNCIDYVCYPPLAEWLSCLNKAFDLIEGSALCFI
jgi:hypothetical protein